MRRDAEQMVLSVDRTAVGKPCGGGFAAIAVTLVATSLWIVGWYWSTAGDIVAIWLRSDTYAHGLTVFPLFVWLLWRKRDRLAIMQPQPVVWLALPAALFGLSWLLGEVISAAAVSHFFLMALLVTCYVAVLGWSIARMLAFPLAFLFFGVPVGDFLLPTLMKLTAEFTVVALRMSGVPVFHEGLQFVVPNGSWSVIAACSGIRYLLASLMVGALYAYLNYSSLRLRLLFMLAALLVPIVANWLRAYMIVMIGYLSDNRLAAGIDHLFYGWAFFGVIILVMFWVGGRWHETPAEVKFNAAQPLQRARAWLGLLPLAAVVAAFPLLSRHLDRSAVDYTIVTQVPPAVTGWSPAIVPAALHRPHYRGGRSEMEAAFRSDEGATVYVHVVLFAGQTHGREMVMWGNGLTPPDSTSAAVVQAGTRSIGTAAIRSATLATDNGRYSVWSWYRLPGKTLTSDIEAKLRLAVERVRGRPDASAAVTLLTPEADNPAQAIAALEAFMAANGTALDAAIDHALESLQK